MSINTKADTIMLYDRWPKGPTIPLPPQDGFPGVSHNVASDDVSGYPLGTKCTVWNDGTYGPKGYSTMIYLRQAAQGANTLSTDACDLVYVLMNNDSGSKFYDVANASSNTTLTESTAASSYPSPVAIAIAPIATGSCGWYWCGGVAPADQYGLKSAFSDGSIEGNADQTIAAQSLLRVAVSVNGAGTGRNIVLDHWDADGSNDIIGYCISANG